MAAPTATHDHGAPTLVSLEKPRMRPRNEAADLIVALGAPAPFALTTGNGHDR
jgi:hypothetical protein